MIPRAQELLVTKQDQSHWVLRWGRTSCHWDMPVGIDSVSIPNKLEVR